MFPTSATLLLRLRADGDSREIAWSDFCSRYEPIIVGFARRQGLAADQIPDLVQSVITGFFAAQPRFVYDPTKGRFRGYLKTCVVHEVQRIRTAASAGARREQAASKPDSFEDQNWDAEWESNQLRTALERVRAHYRDGKTYEAFHRVCLLGQEVDHVASELQISRDSVYQAKSRILARLHTELKELVEQMGD